MNFAAQPIDSETAPEMGWREFVRKCFRYGKRFLICAVCAFSESIEDKTDEEKIEYFLDSGWRYERVFDGINPKCPQCARKAKKKNER